MGGIPCPICRGKGVIRHERYFLFIRIDDTFDTCSTCNGTGTIPMNEYPREKSMREISIAWHRSPEPRFEIDEESAKTPRDGDMRITELTGKGQFLVECYFRRRAPGVDRLDWWRATNLGKEGIFDSLEAAHEAITKPAIVRKHYRLEAEL